MIAETPCAPRSGAASVLTRADTLRRSRRDAHGRADPTRAAFLCENRSRRRVSRRGPNLVAVGYVINASIPAEKFNIQRTVGKSQGAIRRHAMMAHHSTLLYPDGTEARGDRPPGRVDSRFGGMCCFPALSVRPARDVRLPSRRTKGTRGVTVDAELTTTELTRATSWRQLIRRAGYAIRGNTKFRSSGEYWEQRYRSGGNSGAGSYSRLASFKAEVLNHFVATRRISSVIEIGSGDGAQLTLAEYPRYTGVDVSQVAVESTRGLFAGDPSKRFISHQRGHGDGPS